MNLGLLLEKDADPYARRFSGKPFVAGSWYAVFEPFLMGIPMYANAAGIIPIVVLIEKGVSLAKCKYSFG